MIEREREGALSSFACEGSGLRARGFVRNLGTAIFWIMDAGDLGSEKSSETTRELVVMSSRFSDGSCSREV